MRTTMMLCHSPHLPTPTRHSCYAGGCAARLCVLALGVAGHPGCRHLLRPVLPGAPFAACRMFGCVADAGLLGAMSAAAHLGHCPFCRPACPSAQVVD